MTCYRTYLFTGLLLLAATGCELTHVDEAANLPGDAVIAATLQPASEAELKQAMQTALRKMEIGAAWTDGPYSAYQITDEQLTTLASLQRRYLEGQTSLGRTLEQAITAYIEAERDIRATDSERWVPIAGRGIIAAPEDIARMFAATTRNAAATADGPGGEQPGHVLVRSIAATTGGAVNPAWTEPAGFTDVWKTERLSPWQQHLLRMWLRKHAHLCQPYDDGDTEAAGKGKFLTCPEGTLISKWEWTEGGYVFEKPEGNEALITVTGTADELHWTLNSYRYSAVTVIVKGGQEIYVDCLLYNEDGDCELYEEENQLGETANYSGTISKAVTDNKQISNIQFCGTENSLDDCQAICAAELHACLITAGDDPDAKQACYDRGMCLECHDQGGGDGS